MTSVRPVILCGGSGTRLWPLSTADCPKQFRNLMGDGSMLIATAERLQTSEAISFSKPMVIAAAQHRHFIRTTLPDADFLLEPFGRDSAPAIAAAVLASDPDQMLLISPADHFIGNTPEFHRAIAKGIPTAKAGKLVTFGIKPHFPATGYGYIEAGRVDGSARSVLRFVEKPNLLTATTYVESKAFFWNSGIFLFQARTMFEAFQRRAPDVLSSVQEAVNEMAPASKILGRNGFMKATPISIDYAIFEPESQSGSVFVVPVDMGWRDIGDHKALFEACEEMQVGDHSPTIAVDTHNSFIRSDGPLVATIGLRDSAVIVQNGSVLVCALEASQHVKQVAQKSSGFGFGGLLDEGIRRRAINWLLKGALPVWAEIAWDCERDGFKEAVNFDDPSLEIGDSRRVRVQARQVYAFAHGKLLGWDGDAARLIEDGLAYLEGQCFREGKGFIHRIDCDGNSIDERIDLYDQAFILNAYGWAFKALGDETYLAKANDLIALIEDRLALDRGGYADDDTGTDLLRSNPHMHLLEAFITLYEASYDPEWFARAQAIVEMFETYFFDGKTNSVIEYFHADWRVHEELGHRREPGHAYEWATLLTKFDVHAKRDVKSWANRLVTGADSTSADPETGFVPNCVTSDGEMIDPNRRLWPQMERLRAKLVVLDDQGLAPAENLIENLFATYLADAPAGLWMDEYDSHGRPMASEVPASMLYHMVSALAPIIDPNQC